MHQLMIVGAEIAFPGLKQIKLGTFLPVANDLGCLRGFNVVHRFRKDVHTDVVPPSLIFGWFTVFFCKGLHECFGTRRIN